MPVADPSTPLTLTDASFGYEGNPVALGLSAAVRRGDVIALLGANGSGKSTLVRGVLGLAQHLGGSFTLFGQDAEKFSERYRIGYVPQRNTVAGAIPSTVQEVVVSGRLRARKPLARFRPHDHLAIERAMATSGLEGFGRRRLADLSGGQQRRVMIARAIASEPDLLILDEPTAGVDVEHQELLASTMTALVAGGTTIILVAHELGPAEPVISRTWVMTAGRLTYDGPPLPSHRHHDCGGEHEHAHEPTSGPANIELGRW